MLGAGLATAAFGDWTEAHTAADAGDTDTLTRALEKQPGLVDAKDSGDHTPLHLAAFDGRAGAAAVLLAHGASMCARDVCGWTALHTAVVRDHRDVVELLVAKGADINARDVRGQTPLHLALKYHHADLAAYLRQHGGRE
jgi:ankyrin repeat protein